MVNNAAALPNGATPVRYRMEVEGEVASECAAWLGADAMALQGARTLIEMAVADQAQLHGIARRTTMRTRMFGSLMAAAALAASAFPARAQEAPAPGTPLQPVRLHADASLIYARPVGEFADYVDRGFGLAVGTAVPLRPGSPLGLRLDAGVVNYGHETRQVCLSSTVGCRVRVDLTTSNDILFAGFGPQLAVPDGPVQPYVHASLGFAYFGTSSSLRGLGDHRHFATTINQDDFTLSWGGGGGVRFALGTGAVPVLLNLGMRYQDNGRVEYLREGDIADQPDGSITLAPQRSRADLLTFHLGASVGIRLRQRGENSDGDH